ncbi:hypothetical protein Ddye_023158 [Dipteronia dyeriana]|uniref:FAR1 domain-containing protein n=1 Tax=Dipteronia dyeriana TaxID=168575 RepID=A0AAD9TTE7_9ROSI|nr:hypothetical protein Ddye_023158 [Dipteronia dyeriana]
MAGIETTTASNLERVNDLEWKPKCDMEFDSEQSSYDFYNMYGGKGGFSIRREGFGKNSSTGELTSRKFVCNKEGFRSNGKRDILTTEPRAETRTGCNAQLRIMLNRVKNIFFVAHFVEYHNHPLVMQKTHMLPSQKKRANSQAIEVDLAEASGFDLSLLMSYWVGKLVEESFLGIINKIKKTISDRRANEIGI